MRKRVLFESLLAIAAILLFFTMYLMVSGYTFTATQARVIVKWNVSGNDTVYYITACDDGTLRALMGGHAEAVDQDGATMWDVAIPDQWWVGSKYVQPAVAVGPDGTLYVYLRANVTRAAIEQKLPYLYAGQYSIDTDDQNARLMDAYAGTAFASSLDERVIAISPDGRIMWNLTLPSELYDADIQVKNGTIYVHHGFNETAFDRDGHPLWNINDVGAAPVVDNAGYVYSVLPIGDPTDSQVDIVLSGIVEAHYPNGTLYWRHDIGEPTYVQQIQGRHDSMPIYDHGTLYLPSASDITAMSPNGTVQWSRHYNGAIMLFSLSPFDSDGDVYVRNYDSNSVLQQYAMIGETYYTYPANYDYYPINNSCLSVLSPNGSMLSYTSDTTMYCAAGDGTGYTFDTLSTGGNRTLFALESAVLTARDLKSDRSLWSYDFTPGEVGMAMVNETNLRNLFEQDDVKDALSANGMNQAGDANFTPDDVGGNAFIQVLSGKAVTYVNFWTYNYDRPAIFNKSYAAFSGGLYAFDKNGKLLWSRPEDSLVGSMYEHDDTFYYSTGSGKMSAARISVATGLAIAAALYVLVRSLAFCAVSRARSMLAGNDNRNAVFKYVRDRPGSTMYEIARGLGLNRGTVRYHLFILGVNHRIASQKADKKYVRYFPNSNTYSKDEQMIMSLMRRDAIRRVLKALMIKPGLSNVQLSKELGLPESAMSKYMKELYARGIVIKRRTAGGVSYTVTEEAKSSIARALEHAGE